MNLFSKEFTIIFILSLVFLVKTSSLSDGTESSQSDSDGTTESNESSNHGTESSESTDHGTTSSSVPSEKESNDQHTNKINTIIKDIEEFIETPFSRF